MIVATMVGLLLFAVPSELPEDVAPGAGVGLAPNPIVRPAADRTTGGASPGTSPSPSTFPVSLSAVGTAALGVGYRRRRDDPLVVVVHGDGGSAQDFRYIVHKLGMDPDRVVAFDYSSIDGGASSTESSRTVPTWAAAEALDSLIRDLAKDNANIYSLHHSRGGAVGAEMIANIDDGSHARINGYRGAALLDPAIASGMMGALQTAGGLGWGLGKGIPDDGGFDPIRCKAFECHDLRQNLGDNAGVEVLAIRNPDAVVTNFHGRPDGLRVFDLIDDKPSALWYLGNLFAFRNRVSEAHASVLVSPLVADCLRSELDDPGSCPGLDGRSDSYVYAGTASGGGFTKAM